MSDRTDNLAKELLALKGEDGLINVAKAEQWAKRHPKSSLYAHLEWDNEVAGEKYRHWQIRSLISVHIVDAEGSRQLVHLSIDSRSGGYRPINDVLGQKELREIMLEDALGELERMQRKYARLQELDGVWAARDQVKRSRRASASGVVLSATKPKSLNCL